MSDSDGSGSETYRFWCGRCQTEGHGSEFDDIDHEEWCNHGGGVA